VRLLSAEVLKLRTTRPPYILLGVGILLSAAVAAALAGSGSLGDDEHPALALAQGVSFLTVLGTIVGVLLVTNEYRHDTVMTTFLVEPRRSRVLAAKIGASALAGVTLAAASVAAATAVAFPWLGARDETLALDGEAGEAVGRVVLAFALSSMLGAAVGAIVQSQVGAIITVFVWFLVVESIVTVLSGLVFADIGEPDPITPYLPGSALGGIVGGEGNEFLLRGGWASLLATGYVALLSLLGAFAMLRRDP